MSMMTLLVRIFAIYKAQLAPLLQVRAPGLRLAITRQLAETKNKDKYN